MPIGADTPEEIAVSAMGEIIAVRRGASTAQGWTPPLPRGTRSGEEAVDLPAVGTKAEVDVPPSVGTKSGGEGS
jgi:hypothetical protein